MQIWGKRIAEKKQRRKDLWRMIIFWFVLVTLVGSAIFSFVSMMRAPVDADTGKVKGDYTLMLFQCAVAVIIIFLPSLFEHQFKIEIPNYMQIVFMLFLYSAVYLGEVREFYYRVPHWDSILHAISGAALTALGFSLVDIFNTNKRIRMELSPLLETLFAFCFSVTLGALWEIYEFTFDGILGMNMQKFMMENGTPLVGREALSDTMKDIIINTVGALVVCVIGYIGLGARKVHEKKVAVGAKAQPETVALPEVAIEPLEIQAQEDKAVEKEKLASGSTKQAEMAKGPGK